MSLNPQLLDPAIRHWPFTFGADADGRLVLRDGPKGRPYTWEEICAEPLFQDAPYQFETNAKGELILSPASNRHGFLQVLIADLLREHAPAGRAIAECSIQTALGVKVADVAWVSHAFLRQHRFANPYPVAPEIVIEITSPSNSRAEMPEKQSLYFQHNAQEFWLCDQNSGALTFYDAKGELISSRLAPDFPERVEFEF